MINKRYGHRESFLSYVTVCFIQIKQTDGSWMEGICYYAEAEPTRFYARSLEDFMDKFFERSSVSTPVKQGERDGASFFSLVKRQALDDLKSPDTLKGVMGDGKSE